MVAITLGEHGAYVKVTASELRLQEGGRLAWQAAEWAGQETLLPPYPLQAGAEANTNGAGDAFIAGLVAAMLCRTRKLSLKQATSFALLAARYVRWFRGWRACNGSDDILYLVFFKHA